MNKPYDSLYIKVGKRSHPHYRNVIKHVKIWCKIKVKQLYIRNKTLFKKKSTFNEEGRKFRIFF